MSDTPTTNWCTLNPISSNASLSLSNGNLDTPSTQDNKANNGTIGVSLGKWYWEVTVNSNSKPCPYIGVTSYSQENDPDVSPAIGSGARSAVRLDNPFVYKNYTAGSYTTGGTNEGTTGTIGIALNFDSGEIKYYRDNTLFHTDTTIPTNGTTLFPYIGVTFSGSSGWQSTSFNFGQRAFAYTPPTGHKALNTSNLSAPTVKDGSEYFNTVLYTGNSTQLAVTGVGFSPDFVWIKNRSAATFQRTQNTVSGLPGFLSTNSPHAENNLSTSDYFRSFDSDGFTVSHTNTPLTGTSTDWNANGNAFVSWNWLAGNGTSSNTDGSITSTVSANPSAGFSIVTYTGNGTSGATWGHGLGVTPKMVIFKNRDDGGVNANWTVYNESIGLANNLYLNTTNSVTAASIFWDTAPSSTVFTVKNHINVNSLNYKYIAYCFAEVEGYSKFGSYVGNGSPTDGPFIATSFAPAMVVIKNITTNSNWIIRDSARSSYNQVQPSLYPNLTDSEINNFPMDFLANGFKIRDDNGVFNTSGNNYIFMCFAENPFGGSGVSPATAR
jgi:hypothetical protein